jgi:hypothetical protein
MACVVESAVSELPQTLGMEFRWKIRSMLEKSVFHAWPNGPEQLQNSHSYVNILRPSIHFTMEMESDSAIPFLDVLIIRKETTLATKVYRKPIHTGRYLNFKSNHPPHVKRGLIQSLHNRPSTICQERQDLPKEISSLRRDLQLNGYPQDFIDSIINSKGSSRLNKEQKPLSSVYIPYVKGVSRSSKIQGIDITSSKLNTLLGVHS